MNFLSTGHFPREKFWGLFFLGKAKQEHRSFPMEKWWCMIFKKQNKTNKHPAVYYCELFSLFFLEVNAIVTWNWSFLQIMKWFSWPIAFIQGRACDSISIYTESQENGAKVQCFYFLCREPEHMHRLVDGARWRMLQGIHLRDLL